MKLTGITIGIGNDKYRSKELEIGKRTRICLKKEGGGGKLGIIADDNDGNLFLCANDDGDKISFSFKTPSYVKVCTRTGQSMRNDASFGKFAKGTFCSIKVA